MTCAHRATDVHPAILLRDDRPPQRLPLPAPGSQAELALVALALNGMARPADFDAPTAGRDFLRGTAWLANAGYPVVATDGRSPRWAWRGMAWPTWPGEYQIGEGWSFTIATLRAWAIARVLDA